MISFKVKNRGRGLRQKLKLFTSGKARDVAANVVADALIDLVDEGFDTRSDPYGFSWAPHATPQDHAILEDTRALRGNFFSLVIGGEVSIQNTVGYSAVHQNGSSRIPQRAMLPDGPMPTTWQQRIDQNVAIALRLL